MIETGAHTLGQTAAPEDEKPSSASEAQLVLLFECRRPAVGPLCISLEGLQEVQIGRGKSREISGAPTATLAIADKWLSSSHAQLQNSFGRWILHDQESKNGTFVNGDSITRRELKDGDLIELGHTFFLFRCDFPSHVLTHQNLENVAIAAYPLTVNPELSSEITKLEKLVQTNISILVLGESGSGKEVLAQHLHQHSTRRGNFVAVNCGALPAGLVESELFGHKKGSFSGATNDHQGLIRSSDHGTLFLDEIADLPNTSQSALLRVLQEKEVRPVGATQSDPVDLHIVSATHLNIDEMIESGSFRRDLYARVSGYRVTLPPLRKRPEDIGLLIAIFLNEENDSAQSPHRFTIETARKLLQYPWPLNIRELQACLKTAAVLAGDNEIDVEHLPENIRCHTPKTIDRNDSSEEDRKAELLTLLAAHKGNISEVARQMNKDRKQIQRWIKRFSIDIERFRQVKSIT